MEDESQMRADRRSEFELSESRVEDEHSSARTALDACDCSTTCLEIPGVKGFHVDVSVLSILTGAADANPANKVVYLLLTFQTKIQEAWRPKNFTSVL